MKNDEMKCLFVRVFSNYGGEQTFYLMFVFFNRMGFLRFYVKQITHVTMLLLSTFSVLFYFDENFIYGYMIMTVFKELIQY